MPAGALKLAPVLSPPRRSCAVLGREPGQLRHAGWMNDLLDFPLKLSVWDKDKGTLNRDDPLGAAQLNLTPLKKKFLMAETLDIVHKSVKRGVLHISVSWSTPQLDRKLFELSRGPSSSLASMSLENKALLEKVRTRLRACEPPTAGSSTHSPPEPTSPALFSAPRLPSGPAPHYIALRQRFEGGRC